MNHPNCYKKPYKTQFFHAPISQTTNQHLSQGCEICIQYINGFNAKKRTFDNQKHLQSKFVPLAKTPALVPSNLKGNTLTKTFAKNQTTINNKILSISRSQNRDKEFMKTRDQRCIFAEVKYDQDQYQ